MTSPAGSAASAATELLERRAALLARPPAGGAPPGELDEVTERLRALLSSGPAVVRRVRLEDDDLMARRLAARDPVNPVAGEADLQDRFDRDRRVFVLEHPSLPGRPLNVVWVALCREAPRRLADVLDPGPPALDPATAEVAVFYSIWNVEPGLVGLGRAADLLDGAVDALGAELGGPRTCLTLSPVPGFRPTAEREGLADGSEAPEELAGRCAHYLVARSDGRLVDPVARFHMGNGARLLRVLAGADTSPLGMQRAWGVMASYRYVPEDRPANRAALLRGEAAVGPEVAALLGA